MLVFDALGQVFTIDALTIFGTTAALVVAFGLYRLSTCPCCGDEG